MNTETSRPGIARALPATVDVLRTALAHALQQIAMLAKENARLRSAVAERDEHIAELQAIAERAHT